MLTRGDHRVHCRGYETCCPLVVLEKTRRVQQARDALSFTRIASGCCRRPGSPNCIPSASTNLLFAVNKKIWNRRGALAIAAKAGSASRRDGGTGARSTSVAEERHNSAALDSLVTSHAVCSHESRTTSLQRDTVKLAHTFIEHYILLGVTVGYFPSICCRRSLTVWSAVATATSRAVCPQESRIETSASCCRRIAASSGRPVLATS